MDREVEVLAHCPSGVSINSLGFKISGVKDVSSIDRYITRTPKLNQYYEPPEKMEIKAPERYGFEKNFQLTD